MAEVKEIKKAAKKAKKADPMASSIDVATQKMLARAQELGVETDPRARLETALGAKSFSRQLQSAHGVLFNDDRCHTLLLDVYEGFFDFVDNDRRQTFIGFIQKQQFGL